MADDVKVDKKKFDDVLKNLIDSKPLPKKKVKASMKKKLGKVIDNKSGD